MSIRRYHDIALEISDNRRIAKNTLFLYSRMLIVMGVSLYTSRVILERLGVSDYGIYNVVGGLVTMFSVLSNALTASISRFLTFELGKGEHGRVREIFATSVTIQLCISLVVAILVEVVGMWFLNNKMDIPADRIDAARWVLHCSTFTFVINMISVPYHTLIIAHERMSAFAYISIVEVLLKLAVALLLYVELFDSLKAYAVMIAVVAVIVRLIYGNYSHRHFPECRFSLSFNRDDIRDILSFTGWNCVGGSAFILNTQGVNILLNLFYGTVVNAARGLAVQVNMALTALASNFLTAVNPQIIKSYASGDMARMQTLIFQSSRFALYLMLIFVIPVAITANYLFSLWLTEVPPHTVPFVRLVLLQSMIELSCLPLQIANQATGKVKIYHIVAGGVLLLNFPLSCLVLYMGCAPEAVYVVAIAVSLTGLFARLLVLRYLINISVMQFLLSVDLRGSVVAGLSFIIPFLAYRAMSETLLSVIAVFLLSWLMCGIVVLMIGITGVERRFVINKIKAIRIL